MNKTSTSTTITRLICNRGQHIPATLRVSSVTCLTRDEPALHHEKLNHSVRLEPCHHAQRQLPERCSQFVCFSIGPPLAMVLVKSVHGRSQDPSSHKFDPGRKSLPLRSPEAKIDGNSWSPLYSLHGIIKTHRVTQPLGYLTRSTIAFTTVVRCAIATTAVMQLYY